MQPRRAQHRPPATGHKNRHRAALAEQEQRARARREKSETTHADAAEGKNHGQDVDDGAKTDDEGSQAQVAAELAQRRRPTPERGVSPAAVVAGVIADADEHTARRAEDGSFSLSLEHDLG